MSGPDSAPAAPDDRRPPLLEGRRLQKWYGGLAALKEIDIVIHPGDMVGVIGPNGSGKTTLFDCLTMMEPLSAGRVYFKGEDITKSKPHKVARLGLSRTFQAIRIYRNLTVLDNMLLSRSWEEGPALWFRATSPRTARRAHELLDLLTLGRHWADQAGSLSWGQQRLLEIGMMLMPDPELMLLDEATSGVNPALIEVIKERILNLNRAEGKTIVLIEHDIEVVADLCDRVLVLDYGKKLAEGSVDAVFADPAVVEAYLGKHDVDG